MDQSLLKISIFCTFLKLNFSGLKSVLFYPEYKTSFSSSKKHFFYSEHQKTIFFCLICQKNVHDRMFDFFLRKPWTNPFEKFPLLGLLKNFLFYPECKKMIFSGLICPKNKDDKKFDFLTKTVD